MTTYIPYLTLPEAVFGIPAVSVLLPVALGTAVGYSTRPSETQNTYLALKQPPLRPPPAVFGPVWTLLYGSMGYAAYRAWTTGMNNPALMEKTKQGATLYTIQLGLNLVWMPLFFKFKKPILATADIVALTGTVGYLTYLWGQVDEIAGYALLPYLGWLGFATYLSAGAGHLNDWNFDDKESSRPPSGKNTKFVDETAQYVDDSAELANENSRFVNEKTQFVNESTGFVNEDTKFVNENST